ncbi:hypothetical protein HDU93_000469 [Gonapodya sp. JEL0774]|nr:hypothetical protein HDU93_000469 [Gonapodya sp. JEL0774]
MRTTNSLVLNILIIGKPDTTPLLASITGHANDDSDDGNDPPPKRVTRSRTQSQVPLAPTKPKAVSDIERDPHDTPTKIGDIDKGKDPVLWLYGSALPPFPPPALVQPGNLRVAIPPPAPVKTGDPIVKVTQNKSAKLDGPVLSELTPVKAVKAGGPTVTIKQPLPAPPAPKSNTD